MVTDLSSNSATTTPYSFLDFISARCRGYVVHEAPLGTLVEGRAEFGCNLYASGEHLNVESIMVRAWRDILDWFGRLFRSEEGAEEKWEMPVPACRSFTAAKGHTGTVDDGWAPSLIA